VSQPVAEMAAFDLLAAQDPGIHQLELAIATI
jgi:hypothetical protein